ncbi:hypothetical protein BDN72DRAFT_857328 [Pluteus cervinus]|uniref:Uncharacterized protein n=1 Tax=Pluteus cervinus TaxID=181527 RepID=A0ACD3AW86_9AGAR|nr:hypothetical protein BDN72DRAFT_857328 [Pluteus cervinus]
MVLDCSSPSFLNQVTWTGDEQYLRLVDSVSKNALYCSAIGVVRWVDLNCGRGWYLRDEIFQNEYERRRARYTLSLKMPDEGFHRDNYKTIVGRLEELQGTRAKTKGIVQDVWGEPILKFEKPVFDDLFGEDVVRVCDKRGFMVMDDQVDLELEAFGLRSYPVSKPMSIYYSKLANGFDVYYVTGVGRL